MGIVNSKSPLQYLFASWQFKKNCISSVAEVLEFKMRTSLTRLAKGFGELATIRGTTRYHMSPFEQRALAGIISHGIPNTLWRIKCSVMYVLPPFVLGWVVYDTVEKEHDRLQRKQPGQFDHETYRKTILNDFSNQRRITRYDNVFAYRWEN